MVINDRSDTFILRGQRYYCKLFSGVCGVTSSLFSFELGYNFGCNNFRFPAIGWIFGLSGVIVMSAMSIQVVDDVLRKAYLLYYRRHGRLFFSKVSVKFLLLIFISACASINVVYLTHKMLWPSIGWFSLFFSITTFLTNTFVGVWSITETLTLVMKISVPKRIDLLYLLGYTIGLLSAWSIFPVTIEALNKASVMSLWESYVIAFVSVAIGAMLLSYGTACAFVSLRVIFWEYFSKRWGAVYNRIIGGVVSLFCALFSSVPRIEIALEYISESSLRPLLLFCCAVGRFCLDYWFLTRILVGKKL